MFRRADFQFYAMVLIIAIVMHTCDWLLSEAFRTHLANIDRKESVPVELHIAVEPTKPKVAVIELTDTARKRRCKASRECSKMAEALVYEARGESLLGAIAVGFVIVERTKNPTRWPKTVRGVVGQKGQFTYLSKRQKGRPKPEDWERAYLTSYQILHGEVNNPIGASDHYHTLKVRPKWAKKMRYVATVGQHKFYRDTQ